MGIIRQLNRSISTTIFLNVVFVLLWFVSAFWLETEKNAAEITIFNSFTLFSLPYFWGVIMQLICFVLIAFFVYKVIFLQYFTIATYLPFSVLMFFGTFFESAHLFGNQMFATIFFVFALWQFIKIDTRKNNAVVVLNTFLLLIISAFFVPEFIYFVPVFIFGFFYFIELKIRLLMVMIFAISMPILCAFGVCFLLDKIDLFYDFFIKIFDFNFRINIKIFEMRTFIYAAVSIFLVLISLFFFLQNIKNHKFKTRQLTLFFVILWFSIIFLFIFLQNNFIYFILIYIILVSFFISLNFINLQPKRRKKVKPKLKRRRKFRKLKVKN